MRFSDRTYKALVLSNCLILFVMAAGALVLAATYRARLKDKLNAFLEAQWASSRFVESLDPKDPPEIDYPQYDIRIKPTDLRRIQVQVDQLLKTGYMADDMKTWYPARFIHEGEEYRIKLRLRGDLSAHWANAKKSWRLEFKKEKLFEGRRVIDLIVSRDKSYAVEHVAYDVARENGLLVPDAGFAKVLINGVDFGAYTWIEKYGAEMLEKQGYPVGEIFREPNIWMQTRFNGFGIINYSDYTGSIEPVIHDDPSVGHYVARWDRLMRLVRDADDGTFERQVVELVDMEKYLTWNAITWMFGSTHSHGADNLRWYYDNTSGLFEPILYDVQRHPIALPDDEKGPLAKRSWRFEERWRFEEHELAPLAHRTISIPAFRQRRNEILWRLVNDAQFDLTRRCRGYDEQLYPLLLTGVGAHDAPSIRAFHEATYQILSTNRNELREHLSFARVFVAPAIEFHKSTAALRLDLVPDSRSAIRLNRLTLKLREPVTLDKSGSAVRAVVTDPNGGRITTDDLSLSTDKSGELTIVCNDISFWTPMDRSLRHFGDEWGLEFEFPGIEEKRWKEPGFVSGIEMTFTNSVSNQNLPESNVLVAPILYRTQSSESYTLSPAVDEWITRSGLPFENKSDRLALPAGEHTVGESLTLPTGYGLELSPGCTLKMAPGVSILSYGPLTAEGTADRMVRIVPAGDEPWGSMAVVRAKHPSRVRHLEVRGGSETYRNGLYLSGQLCFYHSDVEMDGCVIRGAAADDGLNIKQAQFRARNCVFIGNSADGFDADWTTGTLRECVFEDNRGDGLDFSGSRVVVHDCVFGNCRDKGVSIGERSTILVFNSVIRDNEIGLASKDLSTASIYATVFYKNTVAIAAYRKKQLFGGGGGDVTGTLFWDNGDNLDLDAESSIDVTASAAEFWQPAAGVRTAHLLKGPIQKYYSVDDLAAVAHKVDDSSPFAISVSTEQATLNEFTVPQLSGSHAGLLRPLDLSPPLTDYVRRYRASDQ